MFKPEQKVFLGSASECALWLPFARSKADYLERLLGHQYMLSSKTALDGGGYVLVEVYQSVKRYVISAGAGDYLFCGSQAGNGAGDALYDLLSLSNQAIRLTASDPPQDKGFSRPEQPYIEQMEPSQRPPQDWWVQYYPDYFTADDLYHNKATRFDWHDDYFLVLSGAGVRYWRPQFTTWYNPETPSASFRDEALDYPAITELLPELRTRAGQLLHTGPEGTECVACAFYQGWMIAVTMRGVLKYWKAGDVVDGKLVSGGAPVAQELLLPLPSWVDDTIDKYWSGGASCFHDTYQHAWGRGDDGVQWNFDPSGTYLVGNINKFIEWQSNPSGTCAPNNTNKFIGECCDWIVQLNPVLDVNGALSFTPIAMTSEATDRSLVAKDFVWSADRAPLETALLKLVREQYHDTGGTLCTPEVGNEPSQGDLYQNDYLIIVRAQVGTTDKRFLLNCRRTEVQNMSGVTFIEELTGSKQLNSVDQLFIGSFQCDLRYAAYHYGGAFYEKSRVEIEAIEGGSYFLTDQYKTSYNYIEAGADIVDYNNPVVHSAEVWRDNNSYANASRNYFINKVASFPVGTPMSFLGYQYFRGNNIYVGNGLACQYTQLDATPTYSYKFASMSLFTVYDTDTFELDFIDLNGEVSTHADVCRQLGQVQVPITINDYDYHMSPRPSFCSHNLFLKGGS